MTTEAKKGGMPLWAKILIGLVILGILGGIAAFAGLFFFVSNTIKQAQDPAAITRTAAKIATFEQPLPQGFKFVAGLDLMGIDTVVVENETDNQSLTLISYPKKEEDPAGFVKRVAESGVSTGKNSAKLESIKEEGKSEVAGSELYYVIGKMSDKTGQSFEGMVGCSVSKTRDKTLLIYGRQPLGTPYKMETTKKFLTAIKSF